MSNIRQTMYLPLSVTDCKSLHAAMLQLVCSPWLGDECVMQAQHLEYSLRKYVKRESGTTGPVRLIITPKDAYWMAAQLQKMYLDNINGDDAITYCRLHSILTTAVSSFVACQIIGYKSLAGML